MCASQDAPWRYMYILSICPSTYLSLYLCMIYFKELAHMIMEAGKYEIHRVDQQAENSEFLCYSLMAEFLLRWENSDMC